MRCMQYSRSPNYVVSLSLRANLGVSVECTQMHSRKTSHSTRIWKMGDLRNSQIALTRRTRWYAGRHVLPTTAVCHVLILDPSSALVMYLSGVSICIAVINCRYPWERLLGLEGKKRPLALRAVGVLLRKVQLGMDLWVQKRRGWEFDVLYLCHGRWRPNESWL